MQNQNKTTTTNSNNNNWKGSMVLTYLKWADLQGNAMCFILNNNVFLLWLTCV